MAGGSRQGGEVNSPLRWWLSGSTALQNLSKWYWAFTARRGWVTYENHADMLTFRWGKIRTWLSSKMVGNI